MRKFAIIALLAVGGCNGVQSLGTIGGTEFYKVKTFDLDGPNVTAIVTKPVDSDQVTVVNAFAGPGPLGAIISSSGDVAAQAVRRPDETNIKVGGSNASGGSATAAGGNGGAGGESRSESSSAVDQSRTDNRVDNSNRTDNRTQINNQNNHIE